MQNLHETLSIDTPENVVFGYSVAGIGSRFLAAMIDTTILSIIIGFIYAAFLIIYATLPATLRNESTLGFFMGFVTILAFLVFWGFYIFFELTWNGQTPGKRWVGLRVVRLDGAPVSLVESIIRNLVRIIDFLPAYYGIGLITMFLNSQARRLGDLAASTLVIYEQGTATIETLSREMSATTPVFVRFDTPLSLNGLEISRLKPRSIELAEVFLRRRHLVGNQQQLADQVLQLIEQDLGGPVIGGSAQFTATDQIAAVINEVRK